MTGRYETPRLPGVAPSAGEATTPAYGAVCATPDCGHIAVLHNLAGNNVTRTACSVSSGPKGTPCPCKRFTTPQLEETTP